MEEPSPLEEFQKRYGTDWQTIVESEPFKEAFKLLHIQRVAATAYLTDQQIEVNSRELLSDLRGWLQHEAAMLTLHDKKIYKMEALPDESYEPPSK